MVDVGYNIDGRHGVIRNVVPLANTTTEHLCFTEVRGDEQYALKKYNIDYVIPHEEEITCEEDKMTFTEKFKEVFGLEPRRNISLCNMVRCEEKFCHKCPFYEVLVNWDSPYKKFGVTE